MAAEELIEVKFRLADGTDIGPSKYSSNTTVGSLKEKIISQWPKDKENGPKTINDLKLINAGKILENNKSLAESRSPVSEVPGGVITMLVVLRPPMADKNTGVKLNSGRLQPSKFAVEAAVGDTTAVPNESTTDHESVNAQTYPRDNSEKDSDSGDPKMDKICDKLIDVFMVDKPNPIDWRRLLAFSKEWDNIRPHFFTRCQNRADRENDPGMKHNLLRLGRKLKEVDEDVQRHNELLQIVKNAPSEIGDIVARRRKDFTKEFFMHLHAVAESYHDNEVEQNAIAKIGNTCLAAVQAYDTATESIEAINAAELKFQDIINSPSVDAACRKIDNLAEKNQLDSALVLMITKAWSAAKETDMMKDEVKDILYHLYMTARGNLQRLMPKEVRIVKYLLTIEDPERLLSALNDAFTPGEELEGKDFDNLYTTPEKLHTWIKAVVNAYHFSREGTLIKEARDLMNPKIIQKMEEIEKLIRDKFL